MLAASVRSGLVETTHEGAVAACHPDGTLVARYGDIDRPFFIRSSAKPFQALASQRSGADMNAVELAVASASHRGHPVQVATVSSMLERAGLDSSHLQCPPDWPLSADAALRLARGGATERRSLWHNCSGKHAGFLRACVASGWPTETYLDPDHPLQESVYSLIAEMGEFDPGPVGVDGCGAPVFRTTARVMARLYARLGGDDDARQVHTAMHAYPALVSERGAGDAAIATSTNAASKGGAQGCLGVAIRDGVGVAAKSWDGLGQVAVVAAIEAMVQLGLLSTYPASTMFDAARPPVLGGRLPVGSLEPRLELQLA